MFFCVFYNTMPKNRSIPIITAARILTHLMSLNSFSSLPVIFIVLNKIKMFVFVLLAILATF